MPRPHVKYLLVGGGTAGAAAAVAIRDLDRAGAVLVVGQEPTRPYHRSPLSKGYLLHPGTTDLFTLPAGWFAEHNVELRTGRRASHLDTARQAVTLDNGQEVSYDALLLATGAAAVRLDLPGANLPNLFTVRTLADVERLRHAIDVAKATGRTHPRGRGRVAVIGGGLLGVELAGTLSQADLAVHLIVGSGLPWRSFAGEAAGTHVARHLESHGIDVAVACKAVALEGDGRVQRVRLSDGRTIPCDLAIAAVGSTPNRELVRNTPLRAETALLVDEGCRTSDPHVWAAGDCAAVFDARFGKHRVVDHWDHAVVTGTIAGTNMAGGRRTYDVVSPFTTTALGLTAMVFGDPKRVARRVVRGSATGDATGEGSGFAEIGIAADGRVAQTLAIGPGHDVEGLRQVVANRAQVASREEELKNLAVPLAAFV